MTSKHITHTDYDSIKIPNDWLDLSVIPKRNNILNIFKCHAKYIVVCREMRKLGYISNDISKHWRVWSHNHKSVTIKKSTGKNSDKIIILDKTLDDDTLKTYVKNSKKLYTIIECTSFSKYDELHQTLTGGFFIEYEDFDMEYVIREFGKVLDIFPQSDSHDLVLKGTASILVPHMVDHYKERIKSIHVIDPVFYPYSYHVLYKSIHQKTLDIQYDHNLIFLLHNVSLLSLYFGRECSDKKNNALYSSMMILSFSEKHQIYLMKNILFPILQMYSKVVLDKGSINNN